MPLETARHIAITRRAVSVAISAAIGLVLLTAHPLAIALTCVVPAIWLVQRDRLSAYLCACSYYAAAIWPVISVVHGFNGSWTLGTAIWTGSAMLLSVPWLAFHSVRPTSAIWCGALGMLASVLPPLGLIAVASPISAAGLLFPGCKLLGLVTVWMLPGLLAWKPKPAFLLSGVAVLFANLRYSAPSSIDWEGVDTAANTTPGDFGDYRRIETMLDRAESSTEKVLVFPEATIRSWTPTTLEFFENRITNLHQRGQTILAGALIPTVSGYRNVVQAFGHTTARFEQRVPVPLGMWHPISSGGVPLNAFGPSVISIEGQKAAVFICYEQLIAWPAVVASAQNPSIAVAIGNNASVMNTPVPALKIAFLRSWVRLWKAQLVTASAL